MQLHLDMGPREEIYWAPNKLVRVPVAMMYFNSFYDKWAI